MGKYTFTIKQAVKNWNENNPTLRQKSITTLSESTGTNRPYISSLGKKYSNRQINIHLDVIFISDDKEQIKKNWEIYKAVGNKTIQVLEKIRVDLGCEIYDLVSKTKK